MAKCAKFAPKVSLISIGFQLNFYQNNLIDKLS